MSGDEIFSMVMAVFPRWETTPELIEIWRRAMSRYSNVPKEIIEGTLAEHYEERDGLPEPVLKRVVDKIETKANPAKPKAVPIPIADAAEQERRHREQFAPIEAQRRADEQRLRDLPPQEFEALKAAALEKIEKIWPVTRAVIAKVSGDDPYKSLVLMGTMLAEMGAVAK